MAGFCPLPQDLPEHAIYVREGTFRDDMAVVHRPTSYHRVQLGDQKMSSAATVSPDDLSYFGQESRNALATGFDEQLPVRVPSNVLAKKVKACR